MEMKIVGHSEDGNPIVSGEYILFLRDTHGLPMSVIHHLLERDGAGFDVVGFILACRKNPNYNASRCLRLLKEDSEVRFHFSFERLVEEVYSWPSRSEA